MNKEAELAKRLAENLPERDRQAALNEAQHLQDLAAPLVNATKDALSNPSPANQVTPDFACVSGFPDRRLRTSWRRWRRR
jgi:hypothetical protein